VAAFPFPDFAGERDFHPLARRHGGGRPFEVQEAVHQPAGHGEDFVVGGYLIDGSGRMYASRTDNVLVFCPKFKKARNDAIANFKSSGV
jgi:hypothetical protein